MLFILKTISGEIVDPLGSKGIFIAFDLIFELCLKVR